ncbi:nicotinic receptor-associated protein [Acrasis kona]|uniref:Nicotinic receptor-associated protein n=1 Tax=Acrasis kona TaxID=1008807 RepID=A0AAW2ZQ13_9EUKA
MTTFKRQKGYRPNIFITLSCQNISTVNTSVSMTVTDNQSGLVEQSTETVHNLYAVFQTQLKFPFNFSHPQTLRFKILHNSQEFGQVESLLSDVLLSENSTKLLSINGVSLTVRAEEEQGYCHVAEVHLKGSLEKRHIFLKPHVKLRISSSKVSGEIYYESEVQKGTSVQWAGFHLLPLQLSDSSNFDQKLRFDVIECRSKDELVGSAHLSARDVVETMLYPITIETLKGRPSGTITPCGGSIKKNPSFLDFLCGGYRMELSVAIDFTSSNGDSNAHNSLHGLSSDYEKAMRSVAKVISSYGSESFSVYGFGASIPPQYEISHCFNTSLGGSAKVSGIEDAVKTYRECLSKVRLSGPTNFAQIIHHARAHQEPNSYQILLILTDGVVTDVDATLNEINQCRSCPISIVIVGIGKDDSMHQIDQILTPKNKERDIITFVPFEKINESLDKVPYQMLSYADLVNLKPNQPSSRSSVPNNSNHNSVKSIYNLQESTNEHDQPTDREGQEEEDDDIRYMASVKLQICDYEPAAPIIQLSPKASQFASIVDEVLKRNASPTSNQSSPAVTDGDIRTSPVNIGPTPKELPNVNNYEPSPPVTQQTQAPPEYNPRSSINQSLNSTMTQPPSHQYSTPPPQYNSPPQQYNSPPPQFNQQNTFNPYIPNNQPPYMQNYAPNPYANNQLPNYTQQPPYYASPPPQPYGTQPMNYPPPQQMNYPSYQPPPNGYMQPSYPSYPNYPPQ